MLTKVPMDQKLQETTYNTLCAQATLCTNLKGKWELLQAAHIVGQRLLRLHVDSHLLMLHLAWQTCDWSEAVGQVFRLGSIPFGHLSGRLLVGNPGASYVSAFSAQEISPCVSDLIAKALKG